MFVFGDSADATRLFLDEVVASTRGPALANKHLEDMSEEDLRVAMTWLHVAIDNALRDGADEAVIDLLYGWHEEVFTAVAEASESFRTLFKQGRITPPGGMEARPAYMPIIKAASES